MSGKRKVEGIALLSAYGDDDEYVDEEEEEEDIGDEEIVGGLGSSVIEVVHERLEITSGGAGLLGMIGYGLDEAALSPEHEAQEKGSLEEEGEGVEDEGRLQQTIEGAAGQERRRTPVGQVHILTPTDTSQTPPVRSLTPTTAARKGTPLSGDRSLDRGPPSDRLPDGSPLPAGGADVAGSSGPGGVRAPQRNFSSSSLSGIDANGTQGAGGAGAAAGEEAGLRVEGGGGGEGEGEEGADAGAGGLDAPTGGEFRSFLPPPPTARCGDDLQAKFAKFLQLKREGTNFNTALRLSKGYRNPDLMQQLVTLHSIRETGSMFERAVFDPQGYADADFYDRLVVQQRQEADRREAERKLRTQIQFQPGGQYLPPGGKPVVQIFTGQKGLPSGVQVMTGLQGMAGGAAGAGSFAGGPPPGAGGGAPAAEGRQAKKSKWDKRETHTEVDSGGVGGAAHSSSKAAQDAAATAAGAAAAAAAAAAAVAAVAKVSTAKSGGGSLAGAPSLRKREGDEKARERVSSGLSRGDRTIVK